VNVGVLASGSGANLQALVECAAAGELGPARLTVVGVNVPECAARARASAAGLTTFVVQHRDLDTRAAFDRALLDRLTAMRVELVVLDGFTRILSEEFLAAFPRRVIGTHPALAPAFPGLERQREVLRYGVKISGCTVQFVAASVMAGIVIAQAAVPVLDDDDEESLRLRVLAEENRLLPVVVRAIAERRVIVEERRARVLGVQPERKSLRSL
jgi:phosphoribosylglycinamide formyltransferase 1